MENRRSRMLAALLAAAMLLGLTACKDKEETVPLSFETSPGYIAEAMALPIETGQLEGSCADGQSLWFLVTPAEKTPPVICRVPLDGGEAELLPECQFPEGDEDTGLYYLGPILGGDGKLWVWEQRVHSGYDLPDDFDPETDVKGNYFTGITETWRMVQLDPASGEELRAVDVTAAMEDIDNLSFNGMAADSAGTLYLADSKHVIAVDSQGEIAFTLEADLPTGFATGSGGGTLVLLPDGTAAALTVQPGKKRTARPIDRDARDWGEKYYNIQAGVDEICRGSGGCLFCYTKTRVLYGMVEGAELPQRLLSWDSASLEDTGTVAGVVLLEEGQAAVLTRSGSWGRYADQIQMFRLSPTDEPPQDGRVKLVYGMIGENVYARQRVKQFNRRNEAYMIEIRDYAEGMLDPAEEDELLYQSALARLSAEIAAGRVPDILDKSVPLETLGKQGVLEDLWPWIDRDPEISRETIMSHVLECAETGGKLYRVCGGFAVETAVTSAKIAGNRTSWTLEEMLDACGGMPELYFGGLWEPRIIKTTFNRFDKGSTLYNLVNMSVDRYVDWESGTCSFDGEDFRSLLQMSGSVKDVENGADITDWMQRWTLDILDKEVSAVEPCQVSPWDGKPGLYTRTLSQPIDLMIDDILCGGREALMLDYEQRLWDADLYFWYTAPLNGNTFCACRAHTKGTSVIQSTLLGYEIGEENLAADYVIGAANGNVYAAYAGFPSESGAGSCFVLYDSVAVSATCEAKEGAWAFVRNLLLPDGNTVRWDEANTSPNVNGFPMDRAGFESQLEPRWFTDDSGEYYLDANGEPVEYATHGLGVGNPGPLVMVAYLTFPSQAQIDRFWDLYNAIDHVSGGDADLLNVITEQAQPYFAGDKSLDETADLIQRRASLYVNENR